MRKKKKVSGDLPTTHYSLPTIFVFGNPDLKEDSLPLRILPKLRKIFPEIKFEIKDPNEEWFITDDLTIIDTVVGIDKVTIFYSLENFARSPRISLHDFDAYSNLLLLQKLGKLKKIKILGIPPTISEKSAIEQVSGAIVVV